MPYDMQQTGLRPTRYILLVALLVVSIVSMVVYANEGESGPLHSLQDATMNLTGQAKGSTVGIGVVGQVTGDALSDATAGPSTLSALREENEQLRQQLAEAEEYRQEADRLRGLLDMKQVSGVTGPVAHIIGRSTGAWDQSVTIDMGSNEGVRAGMTIMGATGVIGQVSRTTEDTATVRLLTDPNSGAAVMIQSSRENGIVHGSINGLLYLEDLDEDVIPEVGDVIVTSGLGGSYERGLIVGAVVNVNKTAANPLGTVIVNPNDSARMLEEVIVVFKAPDVKVAADDGKTSGTSTASGEEAEDEESDAEGTSSSSGNDSTASSPLSTGTTIDTTARVTESESSEVSRTSDTDEDEDEEG